MRNVRSARPVPPDLHSLPVLLTAMTLVVAPLRGTHLDDESLAESVQPPDQLSTGHAWRVSDKNIRGSKL